MSPADIGLFLLGALAGSGGTLLAVARRKPGIAPVPQKLALVPLARPRKSLPSSLRKYFVPDADDVGWKFTDDTHVQCGPFRISSYDDCTGFLRIGEAIHAVDDVDYGDVRRLFGDIEAAQGRPASTEAGRRERARQSHLAAAIDWHRKTTEPALPPGAPELDERPFR